MDIHHQYTLQHPGFVSQLEFSPDGMQLASAGDEIVIWDAQDGSDLLLLDAPKTIKVAFHRNCRSLASLNTNGIVSIWELEQGSKSHVCDLSELLWNRGGGTFDDVSIGTDLQQLATVQRDSNHIDLVKVFDLHSTELFLQVDYKPLHHGWRGMTSRIVNVEFSPDATRLAIAGGDGSLRIVDTQDGRVLFETVATSHQKEGNCFGWLSFANEGDLLTGWSNRRFHTWQASANYRCSTWDVRSLFSQARAINGPKKLVACGTAGGIIVGDFQSQRMLFSILTESVTGSPTISRLAYSPSGNSLAASCGLGTGIVGVWTSSGNHENPGIDLSDR